MKRETIILILAILIFIVALAIYYKLIWIRKNCLYCGDGDMSHYEYYNPVGTWSAQ